MPVIPALRRLRQKSHKIKASLGLNSDFQASLDYIEKLLKENKTKMYFL